MLIRNILTAIVFGFLYQWTSGIMILLGERLLGFQEHYSFSSLLTYFSTHWPQAFIGSFFYIIIFITISLFHYKKLYDLRSKELASTQVLLQSSALETLTVQLQPHFLFNAMNNISMLIRKNENTRAIEMTAALSNLLRRSMSENQNAHIRLAEELSFLEEYISLEMLRHDKVEVKFDIDDSVQTARIPQMVLQPLVENAFKYGSLQEVESPIITIAIYRKEDSLNIEIFNPGFFDTSWNINDKKGIGLHNTIHRLRQIYGAGYNFQIKEEKEGVRMIIRIPYEE